MFDLIRSRRHSDLGQLGADLAVRAISRAREEGRAAKVLLAAAPSQLPVLNALSGADIHMWPVQYFHMDEYIGLAPGAPQAFGSWLKNNYFDRLPTPNQAMFESIPATGTPHEVAAAYASRLPEVDFDLVLCGIGINGHLAFNDPGCDFEDPEPVREIQLAKASQRQQVDEGLFECLAAVPVFAITLTVPRILASQTIVCSVLGTAKASAMKGLIERPVTNELPATALKSHSDVTVLADEGALSYVG